MSKVVQFVRGKWCSLSVAASAPCPRYQCSLSETLVHFVRELVHFVPHISKSLYLSLGVQSPEFKVCISKQIDQRPAVAGDGLIFSQRKAIQKGRTP